MLLCPHPGNSSKDARGSKWKCKWEKVHLIGFFGAAHHRDQLPRPHTATGRPIGPVKSVTNIMLSSLARGRAFSSSTGGASFLTETQASPLHTVAAPASRLEDIELPWQSDVRPTLLPGDHSPLPAARLALAKVAFRTPRDATRFARLWLQSPCQRLLLAFTWHAVAKHFQPAERIAEARLFSELASAHAHVFAVGDLSAETKDTMAWYLPEALSHAAFCALRDAFPRAPTARLGESLQPELFSSYVAWTSGFGGPASRQHSPRSARAAPSSPTSAIAAEGAHAHARQQQHHQHQHHGSGGGLDWYSGAGGATGGVGSPRVPLSQLLAALPSALDAWPPSVATNVLPPLEQRRMASPRITIVDGGTDRRGVGGGAGGAGGGACGGGAAGVGASGGGSGLPTTGMPGAVLAGSPLPVERPSMVVGSRPLIVREKVDLAACSPLMTMWLQQKHAQSIARGGSSAREPHRVRCSRAVARALSQDDLPDHRDGTRRPGFVTFRDVRRDAARRTELLLAEYSNSLTETSGSSAVAKVHATQQIAALRREEAGVLADPQKSDARGYANYLVATRRLEDATDERGAAGHREGESGSFKRAPRGSAER